MQPLQRKLQRSRLLLTLWKLTGPYLRVSPWPKSRHANTAAAIHAPGSVM